MIWTPNYEEGSFIGWERRWELVYTVQTFETLIIKDANNQLDTIQAWADRGDYEKVVSAAARAAELIKDGIELRNIRVIKKMAEFNIRYKTGLVH